MFELFTNCNVFCLPVWACNRFAFVSFASVDDAEKAMKSTDVQTLLGQDVTIAFAKPRDGEQLLIDFLCLKVWLKVW